MAHENSIREWKVRLAQAVKRLLDAEIERLISIDERFCVGDGFEAGLYLEVEREGSIVRRMRSVGLKIETAASGFIGTDALDDRPRLSQFAGELENAINLVAAGESTTVEENFASGSFFQYEAGSFEHDLRYEVVLLDGVFDISR